jgi:site-specific recombinase XerD
MPGPIIKRQPGPLPARAARRRSPVTVYLTGLSKRSQKTALAYLRIVTALFACRVEEVSWETLEYEHVREILQRLRQKGLAPATVNGVRAVLRGVAQEAWKMGLMEAERYHRICTIKPARGKRLPAGRALTDEEQEALLDACLADETPAGARDACAVALVFGGGLRRSECVALDLADYNARRGSLKVRGKGDKERLVFLDESACAYLEDWIAVRGRAEGALLAPVLKSGKVVLRRLTDQTIYNALRKRALAAGIEAVSPHDGRRTYISDLLDAGADISAVQQLVGHASVSTTQRYDRRGEKAMQKAAALRKLPRRRAT